MRKQSVVIALIAAVACSVTAAAQPDASKLYQGKCVGCHAADGTGSSMGKKLGVHDFHSPDVQGQSDDQLGQVIAAGKNKMPGYEKSLKPDEIKGLAAYVRTLGKK